MEVRLETVTPYLAQKWLEKREINRPLRERKVNQYAEDMLNGRWDETAQTISFNMEGKLFDGQHRLSAIVKSGVTVRLLVARKVKQSGKYDIGLVRSIPDQLALDGKPRPTTTMVSMAKLAIKVNEKFPCRQISAYEVDEWLERNDRNIISQVIAMSCYKPNVKGVSIKTNFMTLGLLSFIKHFGATDENLQIIKHFCKVIATGYADGPNDNCIIKLRNSMINGFVEYGFATCHSMTESSFNKMLLVQKTLQLLVEKRKGGNYRSIQKPNSLVFPIPQ